MKSNVMTLRAFSQLITGDSEVKHGVVEWMNTGEIRWHDTPGKSRWFRDDEIIRKLEQKWVAIHKSEIIKTEWREIVVQDDMPWEY